MALWYILALLVTAKIPEQDDVLVLDQNNFKQALDMQPNMLVEFYAPWCGHCKKLAPEYAKAAKRLKKSDPPIRIAKVDATANEKLATEYGVKGYPTLKYFVNKKATEYTGGRTADTIYSYIMKKEGPAVLVKSDLEDVIDMVDGSKIAVVLFGQKDSAEFQIFESVAKSFDDITFILSTGRGALAEYSVEEPSLVLFKKFDEGRADYTGNIKTKDLKKFINENKKPQYSQWNDDIADYVFTQKNKALFLFREERDHTKFDPILKEIAQENKGKFVVTYTDKNAKANKKIIEKLGANLIEQPGVMFFQHDPMAKYKKDSVSGKEDILDFLKQYEEGSLEQYLKSSPPPADPYDNGVRVLVTSTFDEVVYDTNKDVLVEFYAPWCGHCKKLAPEYEKAANDLSSVDSIVIAKIDATANEVKGFPVSSFPTLKFFPANNKKGVNFTGARTAEGVIEFLKKSASIPYTFDDKPKVDL